MKQKTLLLLSTLFLCGICAPISAQFYFSPDLPVPQPKKPTDVSEYGYTAHWDAVEGVQGYGVWTHLTHVATQDDEPFYYIDTDFSNIKSPHTIEDPDDNGTTESGFVMGNLDDIHRWGWNIGMPVYADGVLGINNAWYWETINGQIQSVLMNFTGGEGKVYVTMTVCGDKRAKSLLVALQDADNISINQTIDSKVVPVTEEWTKHTIELTGGKNNCYISIVGQDAGNHEPLYYFFDDFSVYQKLKKGEVGAVPYDFLYAVNPVATSLDMSLYPEDPEKYAYSFAYLLTSYNEGIHSFKSPLMFLDGTLGVNSADVNESKVSIVNGQLVVDNPSKKDVHVFDASGLSLYKNSSGATHVDTSLPKAGLYIVKVGDKTYKFAGK